MKNFTLQTLYIKPIHPKLLSLALLLTPTLASHATNHAFTEALDQENIETIQKLLTSYSPDINLQNKPGETALMVAIAQQHIPLIQEILHHDSIDINLKDKHGNVALMFAIKNKNVTLVEQLLTHNDIDINLQNTYGYTALMLAVEFNTIDIATQLLRHKKINVNLQDEEGYTALIIAIIENHLTLIEAILNHHQTKVNLQTSFGTTALDYIDYNHIDLNKPQNSDLWYVSLVKNIQTPSLGKNHPLLQPNYLQALYTQQPSNQSIKQYIDILLINKLSNTLTEKEKTLFYNICLIAYEAKNSHYSMQARGIERLNPSSHYQPLLDQDLIHLLTGYLRSVHMKRVSYTSDWTHIIKCYLWANNPFSLQHNTPTMTLKRIHFWCKNYNPYAELLDTANRTQARSLFDIVHQASKYEAIGTKHLAKALKRKNIIHKEEQILKKSVTLITPIVVAGIKALNHQLTTS